MNAANRHRLLVKSRRDGSALRTLAIIASGWSVQGMLIMDRTERLFKVMLECGFLTLVSIPLYFYISNTTLLVILSILTAHTLNFLMNGQLMVALKNVGRTTCDAQETEEFVNKMLRGVAKKKSISFIAIYGSYAMKDFLSGSDLDVRVIRRRGLINGIRACSFTMRIRLLGLRRRFPIDIYLLDNHHSLSTHISPQEVETAVVLYDADNLSEYLALRN